MHHVRILGWVWIGVSALIAMAAFAAMIYFLTAGDDEKTAGELFFLAIGSIPGVVGGIWLLRARGWARVLLLITGALSALAFPIGTALAGYTFWVLLVRADSVAVFREAPRPSADETGNEVE